MAENYYRKKYEKEFGQRPIPIFCASWLLYPPLKEALLPGGNIEQFVSDYDVFNQDDRNNNADLWRVYGNEYQNSVETLPENTSFQRSLKKWLLKGNHLGYGHGILFIKDGKLKNSNMKGIHL